MSDLTTAIDTARYYIEHIQPAVKIESAWQPMIIVQRADGEMSCYWANAWTPTTGSMLPWSEPVGTPVGRVNLDSTYESISA